MNYYLIGFKRQPRLSGYQQYKSFVYSFYRRQERRKAARAAEQPSSGHVVKVTEEVTKSDNVTEDSKAADETCLKFACDICDFKSNREIGLNIHMSRKHPILEQIDGNTEQPEEIETEYDEEIEHYLRTGEIVETNIQLWEDLLHHLGSNRQEKLVALEAWKQCIDNKFGHGDHLEWHPWKNMNIF